MFQCLYKNYKQKYQDRQPPAQDSPSPSSQTAIASSAHGSLIQITYTISILSTITRHYGPRILHLASVNNSQFCRRSQRFRAAEARTTATTKLRAGAIASVTLIKYLILKDQVSQKWGARVGDSVFEGVTELQPTFSRLEFL